MYKAKLSTKVVSTETYGTISDSLPSPEKRFFLKLGVECKRRQQTKRRPGYALCSESNAAL